MTHEEEGYLVGTIRIANCFYIQTRKANEQSASVNRAPEYLMPKVSDHKLELLRSVAVDLPEW